MKTVDVFCHWLPKGYLDAVVRCVPSSSHLLRRAAGKPVMTDLEARLRMMDIFPGYQQIPSLVSPPIEQLAEADLSPDLARRANDLMADAVESHHDRFPGFVASLPMNAPDAAVDEARRAIKDLGACGVQVFTNVNGCPLDEPRFAPIFELMAELDRPIWLHPFRGPSHADYGSEPFSRYELWWAMGWIQETSIAMGRLVFSGVFERWPGLKIITHHAGGMVPMIEGRIEAGMSKLGSRVAPELEDFTCSKLTEPAVLAFKRFYADTASFGARGTLECGLKFFGADRMLFASDSPFDPEEGPGFIRDTLRILNEMQISDPDRARICHLNAERLLRLQQSETTRALA